MGVIHIAVHEGPPYWRIEASPKKRMDQMMREANKTLKKQGVKDPTWDIRKIGSKSKPDFETVKEHLADASEATDRLRSVDVALTPAQKRKEKSVNTTATTREGKL